MIGLMANNIYHTNIGRGECEVNPKVHELSVTMDELLVSSFFLAQLNIVFDQFISSNGSS